MVREPLVFGDHRIDFRAGELIRDGSPIPLRPKTWSVLLHLVERPGALVSRDELLDAVWPGIAVTPDTLTKSISELRLALGDDAKAPRFIVTVPRRGFRFLPAVGGADPLRAGASRSFVGRVGELSQLADAFRRAGNGERQIVFITGPAGIGKTTLVESLLGRPELHPPDRSVWIARAGCVQHHGVHEPYMPVLDALARLARRPDAGDFAALLRRIAPTWLAQMPWLIADEPLAQQTLQAVRPERMLREFGAFVEELTAERTLVLQFDDLHWCDAATVDLLSVLAERCERARLLVVATYRPAEVAVHDHPLASAVRNMLLQRRCSEIPLRELSAGDVRDYLSWRFPGAGNLEHWAHHIQQHTGGNPLFVTSIAEQMAARGWIGATDGTRSFAPDVEHADLGLPNDVERTISMQIETLSPAERDLLDAASVCGAAFTAEVAGKALRIAAEEAEKGCERLARVHRLLVFAESEDQADRSPTVRFRFAHDLYRQAVYRSLAAGARQRLHQRVGEALEAAYETTPGLAAELAGHFEQGGDLERTLRYLIAAARLDLQRFDRREAMKALESAMILLPRLPDEERPRRELEIRLALMPVYNERFGPASAQAAGNCERALELCRTVGTQEQLFHALYALCHVCTASADLERTPQVIAELERVARELPSPHWRPLAQAARVRVSCLRGDFAGTCRIVERQVDTPGSVPTELVGPEPRISSQFDYGLASWFLGSFERSDQVLRAAVQAARAYGGPLTMTAGIGYLAVLAFLRGNVGEAESLAADAAERSKETGNPIWQAIGTAILGWARTQRGDFAGGLALLGESRELYARAGSRIFATVILAFLADACLRSGDFERGLSVIDEAIDIADRTLDRMYWPEVWRLKGELLAASTAQPAEAEHCFLRALDIARDYDSPVLGLRTAVSLARHWQGQSRFAEARELLRPHCARFGADDVPELAEPRALLGELEGARIHRKPQRERRLLR